MVRRAVPVWQRVDPARFAATTGMAVLPVLIEATDATISGRDDGLVRDRAAPDFGVEKHEIYMVQWYAFAALAIALWAISQSATARNGPAMNEASGSGTRLWTWPPHDSCSSPRRASRPIVASYVVYYLYPRSAQVNYGTLLEIAPAPAIEGVAGGRHTVPARRIFADDGCCWQPAPAGCDAACERALYAMRQAHTMQGKERDRIVRVWLDAGGAPPTPQLRAATSGTPDRPRAH